jgi:hypothetical protein
MLYPPFLVAYAVAYMSCTEAGYDGAQVFSSVNIKKEVLMKIIRDFRYSIEDEKKLYQVQAAALEKLEDIVPDPISLASAPAPVTSPEPEQK